MKNLFKILLLFGIISSTSSASKAEIKWDVAPDFESSEAAKALSGAVCAGSDGKNQWCFAVNDEKKYIQRFSISGKIITPHERMRVLEKKLADGSKKSEPDLEAIAYNNGYLYLVGSHGLTRQSAEFQSSRFFLYRLPVDSESGKPRFDLTLDMVVPEIERASRLRELIKSASSLSGFAEKPLQENGANIEGMAIVNGQIFFGFRAPQLPGGAVIMELPLNKLFSSAPLVPTIHIVDIGAGYGIRDLASVGTELLILAGASSSGDTDIKPIVWKWQPMKTARLLSVLATPKKSRAEALLVLNKVSGAGIRILLFFDDRLNGTPTEYTIPFH